MTTILYEHPLNERIRNYLKLEQLFAQAHSCANADIQTSHQVFVNALFTIIDTLELSDIKGELIKISIAGRLPLPSGVGISCCAIMARKLRERSINIWLCLSLGKKCKILSNA